MQKREAEPGHGPPALLPGPLGGLRAARQPVFGKHLAGPALAGGRAPSRGTPVFPKTNISKAKEEQTARR